MYILANENLLFE